MAKATVDVCDMCDEIISEPSSGVVISGENISITWAGRGSPAGEIFENNGQHAPMSGRVSLTICSNCLNEHLS